jgi:anti-sigma factor RsiW
MTGIDPLECERVQATFSDYLDCTVSGHEMNAIASHLSDCPPCDSEFKSWRSMQEALSTLRYSKVPSDMALKLRVVISQQKAKQESRWADRFAVRWENAVRPMLIQVSAGFAGTVALVGTIAMMIGMVAAPEAVMAHDVPLGAMTSPHYLYSVDRQGPIIAASDTTIVVDAAIDASGQVYDYKILSDPGTPEVQKQVAERLMLSVFEPATVFGAPTHGHVIMTFDGISVQG